MAETHRLGFLGPGGQTGAAAILEALRAQLHAIGYEEGRNLQIEQRYAMGALERLPALAKELLALGVNVIVTGSIPSALAAKSATADVPIVVGAAGDLVGNGLATSMQHPGGNITGVDEVVPGLSSKRLKLLYEVAPRNTVIGVMSSATGPTHLRQMEASEQTANRLGITLKVFTLSSASDIAPTFSAMTRQGAQSLIVFSGVLTALNSKQIVELTTKSKMPAMYWHVSFINEGGLMYYGPNLPKMYEQAAGMVDRIFKGENPRDIPIEYPKAFELVINLPAAHELGIVVPESLLAKADRLIYDSKPST